MKKHLPLFFLTTILLNFLFIACSQLNPFNSTAGSISVVLPGNHSRNVTGYDTEDLYFEVLYDGRYGADEKTGHSGEEITFGNIKPGKYTLYVTAYYKETNKIELFSGESPFTIQGGEEGKQVVVNLTYSGPDTDLPINLYSYEKVKDYAAFVIQDGKYTVLTKNSILNPKNYYWFDSVSGLLPQYENQSCIDWNGNYDESSLGVIVVFEDGSYSIYSSTTNALFEEEVKDDYLFSKGDVTYKEGTGVLDFNCKFSDVSDMNCLNVGLCSLDRYLAEDPKSEFADMYESEMIIEGVHNYQVSITSGWYILQAELVVFDYGDGPKETGDSYFYRTAVYIESDYTTKIDVEFPQGIFGETYFYKFNWVVNGGEFLSEPPMYLTSTTEKEKTRYKFVLPEIKRTGYKLKGFYSRNEKLSFENKDGIWYMYSTDPMAVGQEVVIEVQWEEIIELSQTIFPKTDLCVEYIRKPDNDLYNNPDTTVQILAASEMETISYYLSREKLDSAALSEVSFEKQQNVTFISSECDTETYENFVAQYKAYDDMIDEKYTAEDLSIYAFNLTEDDLLDADNTYEWYLYIKDLTSGNICLVPVDILVEERQE